MAWQYFFRLFKSSEAFLRGTSDNEERNFQTKKEFVGALVQAVSGSKVFVSERSCQNQ